MKRGVGFPALAFLVLGALGISTAYGMLLLLPLFVQELGGDEADFGVILSASTVSAVVCIGALIRFPEALKPHVVVAIAVAVYAVGAAGTSLVSGSWTPLVGVGVLLGTAWAVVYTATPMVVSEVVADEKRAVYFGYITGTQQMGIGAGPVIAGFLAGTGLGFRGTFLVASLVCAVAVALVMIVGALIPEVRDAKSSGSDAAPFGVAVRKILGSEAAFPLVMMLLFACLFTSMTSFQTTFAGARGLDFSVYYVTYTVAVIFSRFVLAGAVARYDARLVIAAAVSVMALAMGAFLGVGSSTVVYGVASAALGIGYGLALPTVQAHAVNVSEASMRPRILPIAGLLFQAAILGFPLIAGRLITGFGYQTLFVVLASFTLVLVGISWWRFAAARGGG